MKKKCKPGTILENLLNSLLRTSLILYVSLSILLFFTFSPSIAQTYFNAWLTTCSHLVGPSGDPTSLKLALDQSRGLDPNAPGFEWDILIDLGDWTASQKPPGDEEGYLLAKCLNETLGKDRGRFVTVAGNHDGDPKGWEPGTFARKYVNPLGEPDFFEFSGHSSESRQPYKEIYQILDYPGTRWDRYLVRTGNIIWIMLSDRNEFDELAESRSERSGKYQGGRGSASGMPDGGYPSGSVTLGTFKWWKKVVEDVAFSEYIIITTHHLLPANTTIATTTGNQRLFHGRSGSVGPKGQMAGQLYWIREYDKQGNEVQQYAQSRPFINYLRDHPGAIAAWIGGHTHVDFPEQMLDYRGIYVLKYGVSFINVGALTESHGGGENQMSRLLTFENGKDEAMVNIYIHNSKSHNSNGWYESAIRKIPLGKAFSCPGSTTNKGIPINGGEVITITDAPHELLAPRYSWNLNEDCDYDFNNSTNVIGEDGSPYGRYQRINEIMYSEDSPLNEGKSLDLRGTSGRVVFDCPYQPEMNWEKLTISLWLKTSSVEPQEVISYSSVEEPGKFRLWFDGTDWIWEVAEGAVWRSARWKTKAINDGQEWHSFYTIADGERDLIQLWIDAKLVAEEKWTGQHLNATNNYLFVIGATGDSTGNADVMTWVRPYNGLIDEVRIFDTIIYPTGWYNYNPRKQPPSTRAQ